MNFRSILLAALCLAGPSLAPAVAQLIHISVNNPDDGLLFKADDGSLLWNTSTGYITQLEFTYDSQAHVGALDPGRNGWKMRVENPTLGRNFTIQGAFQRVSTGEQNVLFEYSRPNEDVELNLVFDSLIPTDGTLPQFPLPALGSTEYTHSNFRFFSGNTLFHVPHLAEAYGGVGNIQSITVWMTPIPEPSVYGLAALAMVGAAVVVRKRRQSTVVA